MSDTTATAPELSKPVQEVIENFDVAGWLGETQNPADTITIYNDGDTLAKLSELTTFVAGVDAARKANAGKKLAPKSIADEADEDERDAASVDAIKTIEELREVLAASGRTFHLRGLGNGERKVLNDMVARKFKHRDAVPQELDGEGTVIKEGLPAILGGDQHPEFGRALQAELISRCVKKVSLPGGQEVDLKLTTEQVDKMQEDLPGIEFIRLANKVYDLNYAQYQIDQIVTQDFS